MSEITLDHVTVTLAARPSPTATGSAPARPSAVLTASEARARASFSFEEPDYLPDDFELDEAAFVDNPGEMVLLSYSSQRGNFVLVFAPLARFQAGDDGKRRYLVVAESLVESTDDGVQAALAQQAGAALGIVWEKGGRLNHILGQGLSESELGRIAASIS